MTVVLALFLIFRLPKTRAFSSFSYNGMIPEHRSKQYSFLAPQANKGLEILSYTLSEYHQYLTVFAFRVYF